MKMPKDITAEDANQWLRGSWFLVNGRLCRLLEVRGRRTLTVEQWDADGEPVGLADCRFDTVDLWWPRVGAVNLLNNQGALYVQRRPARQWRRTMSPRELTLFVPHRWAAERTHPEKHMLRMRQDRPELAAALLRRWYPSMDEAIDLLVDTTHVAISPQVLLVQVSFSETVVYYNSQCVGFMGPDRVFVPDTDDRYARLAARQLESKR